MSQRKLQESRSWNRDVPTLMTVQNVVAILIMLGGLAAGYFAYDKRIAILESDYQHIYHQYESQSDIIEQTEERLRFVEQKLEGIEQSLQNYTALYVNQIHDLKQQIRDVESDIREIRRQHSSIGQN